MQSVNSLLDPGSASWQVVCVFAVNDAGQMTGVGHTIGKQHAILLTPTASLSGTVALQDFTGSVPLVPVKVEIRDPGTTTVRQCITIHPKWDGSFSFTTPLMGTFDVSVKAPHWLRKTIPNVVFPGSGYVTGLSFSLVNGDVSGDNNINLADLVGISNAWRSTPTSPNWNPNADLNGDGTVNLADWMIVSKNWRKRGDP